MVLRATDSLSLSARLPEKPIIRNPTPNAHHKNEQAIVDRGAPYSAQATSAVSDFQS